MPKILETFYMYSPLKRFIIIITLLFIISAISVGYSLFNLYGNAKGFLKNTPTSKISYTNVSNELARKKNIFLDPSEQLAISEWEKLVNYANVLLQSKHLDLPKSLNNELAKDIFKTIQKFNSFKWRSLIQLANQQVDPFEEERALNLRNSRKISSLICDLIKHTKTMNLQMDLATLVETQQKVSRITEIFCPYLIGKMISVSMDKKLLKELKSLIDSQMISTTEAANILEKLLISYQCEISFVHAMEFEFHIFKFVRGKLYERGPLAFWLLDTAFGDPEIQYKNILKNLEQPLTQTQYANLVNSSHHPFFLIFVPNFRRAKEKYMETMVLKGALCSELSDISQNPQIFKDVYSMAPLKKKIQNNKTLYYSVGFNQKDENGQEDDYSFEKYFYKLNKN